MTQDARPPLHSYGRFSSGPVLVPIKANTQALHHGPILASPRTSSEQISGVWAASRPVGLWPCPAACPAPPALPCPALPLLAGREKRNRFGWSGRLTRRGVGVKMKEPSTIRLQRPIVKRRRTRKYTVARYFRSCATLRQTLHPKPQTLNPKPEAPGPNTLNSKRTV